MTRVRPVPPHEIKTKSGDSGRTMKTEASDMSVDDVSVVSELTLDPALIMSSARAVGKKQSSDPFFQQLEVAVESHVRARDALTRGTNKKLDRSAQNQSISKLDGSDFLMGKFKSPFDQELSDQQLETAEHNIGLLRALVEKRMEIERVNLQRRQSNERLNDLPENTLMDMFTSANLSAMISEHDAKEKRRKSRARDKKSQKHANGESREIVFDPNDVLNKQEQHTDQFVPPPRISDFESNQQPRNDHPERRRSDIAIEPEDLGRIPEEMEQKLNESGRTQVHHKKKKSKQKRRKPSPMRKVTKDVPAAIIVVEEDSSERDAWEASLENDKRYRSHESLESDKQRNRVHSPSKRDKQHRHVRESSEATRSSSENTKHIHSSSKRDKQHRHVRRPSEVTRSSSENTPQHHRPHGRSSTTRQRDVRTSTKKDKKRAPHSSHEKAKSEVSEKAASRASRERRKSDDNGRTARRVHRENKGSEEDEKPGSRVSWEQTRSGESSERHRLSGIPRVVSAPSLESLGLLNDETNLVESGVDMDKDTSLPDTSRKSLWKRISENSFGSLTRTRENSFRGGRNSPLASSGHSKRDASESMHSSDPTMGSRGWHSSMSFGRSKSVGRGERSFGRSKSVGRGERAPLSHASNNGRDVRTYQKGGAANAADDTKIPPRPKKNYTPTVVRDSQPTLAYSDRVMQGSIVISETDRFLLKPTPEGESMNEFY